MRSRRRALPGFGQAKSCILLFMYGSPSQLETFDPKPDAPAGVRGEFGCIASSVPGLNVCERLPRLAQVMDKVTLIRSVSHPYPIHGVAFATTGIPRIDVPLELNPRDPNHWPFIGSVGRLHRRAPDAEGEGSRRSPIPRNLVLPWAFSSQRVGEVARSGPYGGFLGQAYDPVSTEFVGTGHEEGPQDARRTRSGKTSSRIAASRRRAGFNWARSANLRPGADARPARPPPDAAGADRAVPPRGRRQRVADRRASTAIGRWRTTCSARRRLRQAFDLDEEADETRNLYGMTLFGQASLTAPAAGRGRRPVHHRLLGRVRPGRHRLGHPLGPLPPDEGRAAAGPRPDLLRPA